MRNKRRRYWLLLWVLASLAILTGALRWILVPYRIVGSSMAPTLTGEEGGIRPVAGDIVLVNRLAYVFGPCKRWDIVVIRRKEAATSDSLSLENVKRIVGLPGETLSIRDGALHVNGSRVDYPYPHSSLYAVSKEKFGLVPVTLKENEYFLLGDNSYLSADSRRWGPIQREEIQGRVALRLFPLRRFGSVR